MQSKISLLNSYCSSILGYPLEQYIQELYPEHILWTSFIKADFFIDILNNKEEEKKYETYIEKWMGTTSSFHHRRDNRSSMDYARDLIINWLIEDTTLLLLQKSGHQVQKSGGDKTRDILTHPSADHDIEISRSWKIYNVEILSDFTGFWNRKWYIDLRDKKYLKLQSQCSCILGIDLIYQKYIFITSHNIKNARYNESHPVWRKPAYELNIQQGTQIYDFSTSIQEWLVLNLENEPSI